MLKFLFSSLVALALVSPSLFAADEPADKGAKKAAAADKSESGEGALKGRLPANYAKLVDANQRQKIYAIQTKYRAQIEDLKKQLVDTEAKQAAEIRAVLTAEQQKKLDELASDTSKAKSKKDAKSEKASKE
jgi:Spy/CpxP family protein refolding chaperone